MSKDSFTKKNHNRGERDRQKSSKIDVIYGPNLTKLQHWDKYTQTCFKNSEVLGQNYKFSKFKLIIKSRVLTQFL